MMGKIQRGWEKIDLEKGRELIKAKYNEAKINFN